MLSLLWAAKNKANFDSPWGRRLSGSVRLLGFGTALALGGALLASRSAKAQVGEAALHLGREIQAVSKNAQDTTSLRINGQELNVTITAVPGTVKEVLDGFQGACEADKAFSADKWRKENGQLVDMKGLVPLRGTAFRSAGQDDGVVMCFQKGEGSAEALNEALDMFAKTSDFGAIGKMRYVYAKKVENGKTHVIALWSGEHLKMGELMAAGPGDADGVDPALISRPKDSRRTMSVLATGTPYAAYFYESQSAPEILLEGYNQEMSGQGWTRVSPDNAGQNVRLFVKDGMEVVVTSERKDGKTHVSVAEMGAEPTR